MPPPRRPAAVPPTAARVVLVPPDAWDEEKLLATARSFEPPTGEIRPGDDAGGLVVLRVEPESGSVPDDDTVFEIVSEPRPRAGPLHVAILVDVAESMALPWSADRTRLEAAKEALLAHLRDAGAGHGAVTLFTYAREPRLVAGPFQPSALKRGDIDLPKPEGKARTGPAIDAALVHLAAQSHLGPQALVLLTDGAGDERATLVSAARAARLHIPIHSVVFAPQADAVLHEAARATGGTTQTAALPLTFDVPRRTT